MGEDGISLDDLGGTFEAGVLSLNPHLRLDRQILEPYHPHCAIWRSSFQHILNSCKQ